MTQTRTRSSATTEDGITWYYEQEGTGPDIVLVPDGLGECQMLDKPMSLIAAEGFRVTTFDMPGMSRSSNAPIEAYQRVTAHKLATQIAILLSHLHITHTSVWGCSSGALAVLGLCTHYPNLIRNAMPHEAPLHLMAHLQSLPTLDDATLATTMATVSRHACGDDAAWDALGDTMHARLHANYPRWARGYISDLTDHLPTSDEDLHKRPISWTVGADSPMYQFFSNVVTATKAGLPIQTLPGRHFPYVSHPEEMARYVVETCREYC